MANVYSIETRLCAIKAGVWCSHDGQVHRVRFMQDTHLVNALLQALREDLPRVLTDALAEEVVRRGLEQYAHAIAAERMTRKR